MQPIYERSGVYDLNLPELPNKGIGFVGGIGNSSDSSRESARHISKIAGDINVRFTHNQTHGFGNDLLECAARLCSIATEPVKLIHKMWDDFFDNASSTARFLMYAHSQGCIHLYNALLEYPEERRKRIMAVCIAPGGYLRPKMCGKVTHYRAAINRDIVPLGDIVGHWKARDTVEVLDSHPNASLFDHSFQSPTYFGAIQDEFNDFKYGRL